MIRVLLLEDDESSRDGMVDVLTEAGHAVEAVSDGRSAVLAAATRTFDVLVLDRNVPGMDGLSVLKTLRAAQVGTPVLLLSGLDTLEDRVEGLEAGADDYLGKPFDTMELLARLHALARRAPLSRGLPTRLSAGDLHLDLLARTATLHGRHIDLRAREFRILEFLVRRVGQVVTRTALLEALWGFNFDPRTNIVESYVSRLRAKLQADGAGPLIETVRGAGYRLCAAKVIYNIPELSIAARQDKHPPPMGFRSGSSPEF